MPTRNVNLTEHYADFVERQVRAGLYQNASEVLRAGLRLLEQQTRADAEKLKVLKKLAQEGLTSLDQGQGLVIRSEEALNDAIGKIGQRAARSPSAH